MYRTVAQLDSAMNILAMFFPDVCTRVELPNRSNEGRPIFALRIRAGTSTGRRGVLIVGGMHARELMNPDAIADLQLDLVLAYLNETGITLGGRSWSALDIKIMLEALDIWLLPCANPDGREHVMTVDDLWRPNRRDNPGTTCDGVDVNRNCDIVWGVTTSNTSCNPCNETYLGADRFSEPESRNIRDLCNEQRIDVFLDVHSFSELVLFPWGHAPTQTTDPSQRFTTLATGTCAPLSPPGYQEYMLPRDQLRFRRVAVRIVADIQAVRGRSYAPQSIRDLYATTGSGTDYVYSRHIADPALRKTYGFAFETGPPVAGADGLLDLRESFHPADPTLIKRDTKAGIISLLQQSICAIELIGGTLFGGARTLSRMRDIRDARLTTTDEGRRLISLFERVQFPLLALILSDESLTKEAMRLLETAVKLLESNQSIVAQRDVERGLAFLDALASRTKSKSLRRDLSTVRKQLTLSANKRVDKVLKQLLSPTTGSKRAKKARSSS
jgi:murein tripeptide amidase MpaA